MQAVPANAGPGASRIRRRGGCPHERQWRVHSFNDAKLNMYGWVKFFATELRANLKKPKYVNAKLDFVEDIR